MSNYGDLVNIEELGDKREEFKNERGEITFYCKDCEKIVETKSKNGKQYAFLCNECNGKNVSVGTLEGIKNNYKIK